MWSTNSTWSTSCLWILLFPKNPLVLSFSSFVAFKVLNINKSVSLFTFPDWSVTAPAGTLTFIWLTLVSSPERFTVNCNPYCTVVFSPFTTLSSVKGVLFTSFVTPVESTACPSTVICKFSFVNVLLAKYLSVALNVSAAVPAAGSTVEVIFSTNGCTTSTTSPVPAPPGKLIPDVMVVALFPFPVVSINLSAGIATVITPL